MKTKISSFATILAMQLILSGCGSDPPVLTGRQVEQVFDAQQKMVDQQAALSQGRDDLESDRRLWSERERSDPIVANAIETAGILLACSLPLFVITLLLLQSNSGRTEQSQAESSLIEFFSSDADRLLDQPADSKRANLPR